MINKPNSRKAGGYSLRESLIRQGVTTTEGMRRHLDFVHGSLAGRSSLDITRYRVDANKPNQLPSMG